MDIYGQILNDDFFNLEALFMYGTGLIQQGRAGLAANIFKLILDKDKNYIEAWQNLGNCFKYENRHAEAEAIYKMGLEVKETSELCACMGNLNINNGTPHRALDYYEKALRLAPEQGLLKNIIKFNMGLAYLELGMWEKGFEYYNLGFQAGNRTVRQYANLPEWDGSPGKTVIFWGEQGLGDEIMFSSCIPDAMKICKRVIFDCHPRLVSTFERSFGIECHGTRKNQLLHWFDSTDAECHASITTLAGMVRKKDEDFPGTPYLKGPPQKKIPGRIGISWSGGSKGTRKDLRSIYLAQLAPILSQDFEFYSLQYTPEAAREVCELEQNTGIHIKHYPVLVENQNYDETMGFISSLDLVITVCTTVHHAAGALGVPCWTLVPSKPAWRYGIEGEKTPWYKSSRLFRQKPGETWAPVIHKVSEELRAYNGRIQGAQQEAA